MRMKAAMFSVVGIGCVPPAVSEDGGGYSRMGDDRWPNFKNPEKAVKFAAMKLSTSALCPRDQPGDGVSGWHIQRRRTIGKTARANVRGTPLVKVTSRGYRRGRGLAVPASRHSDQ